MTGLKRVWLRIERMLLGRERSDLLWWRRRVRRYGVRSVVNLGHKRAELDEVTQRQKDLLFPLLKQQLRGDERVILDFGCGPGRFTPDLAKLIGGRAIGVDPMAALLDVAPKAPDVEYHVIHGGRIPLQDASVDVAWVALVLIGITDPRALERAVAELERVLRPGGLLFLIENTHEREDLPHLIFRSIAEYQQLLSWARLEHLHDYYDAGERISVLAGRAQ